MSGGGCFSGILQPVLCESQEDGRQIALKPRFEYTQSRSCKNTTVQAAKLVWAGSEGGRLGDGGEVFEPLNKSTQVAKAFTASEISKWRIQLWLHGPTTVADPKRPLLNKLTINSDF